LLFPFQLSINQGVHMLLTTLLAAALSIALVPLGILSVWVAVLALKVFLMVLLLLILFYAWQRLRKS
jgi:hypothetical protein